MRIRWTSFAKGLWLNGARDEMPEGTLRRAKGIDAVKDGPVRSRWGSTLVTSLAAHSLFRFNDTRYQGASTKFYRAGSEIYTGLDGTRLTAVRMPATVDTADWLFVAGGGTLFKEDGSGNTALWGIAAPSDGFTATKVDQDTRSIDTFDSTSGWTAANCTIAVEGSIKQQGDKSMLMTVNASTTGQVTKGINLNLRQYANGDISSSEDFISVWCRVDNPSNLEFLQVLFDVGGSANFDSKYFSRTVEASSEIPPSFQLQKQVTGLGTFERTVIIPGEHQGGSEGAGDFTSPDQIVTIVERLGQTTIVTAIGTWVRLRLPKITFSRSGPGTESWDSVAGVRLIAKTNANGSVNVYWDDMFLGGGAGLQGTYRYQVTFKNSRTGHRSNPNPNFVTIENVERQGVFLSNLPTSPDAQVDTLEIWRTVGNGVVLFKVTEIAEGTVSYTDRIPEFFGVDSSTSTFQQNLELPFDNDTPSSTFEDTFGPIGGRVLWTRNTTVGQRARVYFSPIGRPEALDDGFDVGPEDDTTVKGVVWNGSAWVFTEAHIYQLVTPIGPPREVFGAPGSSFPHTVVPTPRGIVYQAFDGIRIFNGVQSALLSPMPILRVFRGETAENVAPFVGNVATYGNDEYMITDGVTTLAVNLTDGTWREVGPAASALLYEQDSGVFVASFGNRVLVLEDEGVQTGDNGSTFDFIMETPSARPNRGALAIARRLYLDADTAGTALSVVMVYNDTEEAIDGFITTRRERVEFPLLRSFETAAVRLTGNGRPRVAIYGVELDAYYPGEGK